MFQFSRVVKDTHRELEEGIRRRVLAREELIFLTRMFWDFEKELVRFYISELKFAQMLDLLEF